MRGEPATASGDVYAFGVVLWEVRSRGYRRAWAQGRQPPPLPPLPASICPHSAAPHAAPRASPCLQLMTWQLPWQGTIAARIMYVKANGGALDLPPPEQLPGTSADRTAFARVAPQYTALITQVGARAQCSGGASAGAAAMGGGSRRIGAARAARGLPPRG